jgi:DNA-binding MarR family transcriptional regulator
LDLHIDDIEAGVVLGPVVELTGYHLRRASSVFGNDFSRAVAGTGIRQVLFAILSIVAANPGINQGAAGRALGIQRANMVSLINELVERGLVDRQVAADDRRAFSLTVTTAGNAMIADCLARIHAHEARLLSDLSKDERAALIELLQRIEAKEI